MAKRVDTRLRRGVRLTPESQKVICNVYRYFVSEALKYQRSYSSYFDRVQQRVTGAVGISRPSLLKVLNERDRLKASGGQEKPGKSKKPDAYQCREIIYNVFRYIKSEKDKFGTQENGYFCKVEERAAKAMGIPSSPLFKLIKQIEETQALSSSSTNVEKTEESEQLETDHNSEAIKFLSVVYSSSESDDDSKMPDTEYTSEPEYILG